MKKLSYALLVCMLSVVITGCGEEKKEAHALNIIVGEEKSEDTSSEPSNQGKAVDAAALSKSLLNDIVYDDQLSSVELNTAEMFLNLADIGIDEAYIYESSGATAEEIVVFKCKDSDSAKKAKTAFEQRVMEQTENFTDYVPKEIEKLDDAVIITSKEYAVLSVSSDPGKAKDIIEGAFK